MTEFVCPEAEAHGNPFRYCPVKGCGWMETSTEPSERHRVLTEAWQAVQREVVPLGGRSPWNDGFTTAVNKALNALLALRDQPATDEQPVSPLAQHVAIGPGGRFAKEAPDTEPGRVQSNAEWAASLSVADADTLIGRCVEAKDFQGLKAALHLMAVKDPHRAEYWREVLLLGVAVGRARIAAEEAEDA